MTATSRTRGRCRLRESGVSVPSKACGQEFPQHVAVPRGCLAEVLTLLEAHKIRPNLRDERFAGITIEAEFQGELRVLQQEAVAKIAEYDEGILCAPTAFGCRGGGADCETKGEYAHSGTPAAVA